MRKTTTKNGDIYNDLQALEHSYRKNKVTYWKFLCLLCNKEHIAALQDVKRGKTKSCGCQKNKGIYNGNWKGHSNTEISGSVIYHYKENALKRNIIFEVDIDYLWKVYVEQNKKCPYTGIDLILKNKNTGARTPVNASLDRIDSNLGYVEGNIQWVYKPLNRFKGSMSHEDFVNLCTLVYLNHAK